MNLPILRGSFAECKSMWMLSDSPFGFMTTCGHLACRYWKLRGRLGGLLGNLTVMQHERRLMPWKNVDLIPKILIHWTWFWIDPIYGLYQLYLVASLGTGDCFVGFHSILKWNQWTVLSPTWMLVHVWSNHWLGGSWFLFWDVLMFIGSWWFMHLAFPMATFVSPYCEKPVL